MSDLELIAQIKQDPASFSILFREYYLPIYGYIFRRTGEAEAAADIASETFAKAFKSIPYFNYRGIAIKVWLYRIATNEINLYHRNQTKRNSYISRLDPSLIQQYHQYIEDDKLILEHELEKHQQYLEVLHQLKTLPLKYQEVISLRYFEDKDNKEIAEILNMNEGTLKSILSRGLEKLRNRCNPI